MSIHTRPWKDAQLKELRALLSEYPVIAVADLSMFPASLFQQLRKKLQGKAVIKVSKTNIARMALKETRGRELLEKYAKNSCALVFSEINPFELFALFKKNKGNTAAKPGMVVNEDIIIPAGDTGLPPGPALSDLKAAGLEVRIQGSTIHIAKDKVATKAGEQVSGAVASVLQKLDIKPIKTGLSIVAVLENGSVFEAGVLDIDTDKLFADFRQAYAGSLGLALSIGYPAKATIPLLVQKAFREAKAVALKGSVFIPETMPDLLAKANRQALRLKN